MSTKMKTTYDSSLARMAGNIAAGFIARDNGLSHEDIVKMSVWVARAIITEVERGECPAWITPIASSPTPEHHCEACPIEVRNLYAVAFNLLNLVDDPDRWVRKIGERLGALKRAVALMQPLIDRHFDELGRQPAAPVRPVQEKPEV